MDGKNFTEKDKSNFVQFLNMVAKKAEFKMSTHEIIEYYRLLSSMQQEILPKIDGHILEVKRVIEESKEE